MKTRVFQLAFNCWLRNSVNQMSNVSTCSGEEGSFFPGGGIQNWTAVKAEKTSLHQLLSTTPLVVTVVDVFLHPFKGTFKCLIASLYS